MSEVFKSLCVLPRRSQNVGQGHAPNFYLTRSRSHALLHARRLERVSIRRATKGHESLREAPRLEENAGPSATANGMAKASREAVTEGH